VAAHHLNRPVRLLLGRDEDMEWTGKRHPFEGTYKAGYDNEGNITAVDVQVRRRRRRRLLLHYTCYAPTATTSASEAHC
jgi:xanthine dehydrogenase molybdopterin-binding subunit B